MNKTVKVAALIYSLSILLSRFIGLIRESVIGRVLGDQPEADVYWVAFILPDFLNYLLAGGALSLVLIPLLQAAKEKGGEKERWQTFWRISTPVALFSLLCTTLMWLFVPSLTPLISPGFNVSQLELLNHLSRIIIPAQVFHICGGLISATLQADDRHLAPALAPLIYTGSIILGGLLLGDQLGAEGFAWGVLLGSFLGPFLCPLIVAFRSGLTLSWCWELTHQDVKQYAWRALPVMLGFSVVVLDELIVKRLATEMQTGVVSQLHYARVLMRVPMGVFGLALGMAAFPTLSRLTARGEDREALGLLQKAGETLMILVGLAQVALTLSAGHAARVIWGTSRLSIESLNGIGVYCALLSLGLWAWSMQGLIARGFYARGQTWIPTLLGSMVVALCYPLYISSATWTHLTLPSLFSGLPLGKGAGLTLASSLAISLYVFVLWMTLCHRDRETRHQKRWWLVSLLFKVELTVGLSVWVAQFLLGKPALLSNSTTHCLISGLIHASVGMICFLCISSIFGFFRWNTLRQKLLSRIR